jgi:DNA-binding transcriptional ArsR family regulator
METMSSAFAGLLAVNKTFMSLEHEINAALMNTFLAVALWGTDRDNSDPLTIAGIASKVGLPSSTISRHLRYLGRSRRKGVPGLGLVEVWPVEEDARQKAVGLTPEGKLFRETLLAAADLRSPPSRSLAN